MARLEILSTGAVSARQRVEYWNEVACKTLTLLDAAPVDRSDFFGRIARADFGDASLAEVSSDAASVYHSNAHIARATDAACLLLLQLRGTSVQRQEGREVRLQPGDFTLFDCMRPYELHFSQPVSNLVVRISREVLRRHIGCPEHVIALPMSGSRGASGLASRFLRDLWRHTNEPGELDSASRLGRLFLDLLATAYMSVPSAEPTSTSFIAARRLHVLNHIEAHLSDSSLTPATIARSFNITTRHLHRLFGGGEESLSRYILRRRLEDAAHALENPLRAEHGVTLIAFDYGFNSVAHFCKVFRERYGMSATEYREAARLRRVGPSH